MNDNYLIKHVSSGLVLEPDGEGINLCRKSNSFLQLWKIETTPQGNSLLLNHDLWRAIEALEDGTVKLRAKNGNKSQEWLINSDGTIESVKSGLILTVNGWGPLLGGKVVCEKKGASNQQFQLETFRIEENEYNRFLFY